MDLISSFCSSIRLINSRDFFSCCSSSLGVIGWGDDGWRGEAPKEPALKGERPLRRLLEAR